MRSLLFCIVILFLASSAKAGDAYSLFPVVVEGRDGLYRADVLYESGAYRLQTSVYGDVYVKPKGISKIVIEYLKYNGSSFMTINGSSVAKEFKYEGDASEDVRIEEIRFFGGCNSLKFEQFLCKSGHLTNGIEVKIKSENNVFTFPLLKDTEDIKNIFAVGDGSNFKIDIQPGADQFIGVFKFPQTFLLKKQGTYATNDYVQFKIQDDLSSGFLSLEALVFGFRE